MAFILKTPLKLNTSNETFILDGDVYWIKESNRNMNKTSN